MLLGALYAPDGSLTKRVVMALVEGVSLGTLAYHRRAATGYVAFATACCSGRVAALTARHRHGSGVLRRAGAGRAGEIVGRPRGADHRVE